MTTTDRPRCISQRCYSPSACNAFGYKAARMTQAAHLPAYRRRPERCPHCGQEVPAHGVLIDVNTGQVVANSKSATLTDTQVKVLDALYRASPRYLDRETLLTAGWGEAALDLNDRAVDAEIKRIRKALRPLGLEIETGYNRGYRFVGGGQGA